MKKLVAIAFALTFICGCSVGDSGVKEDDMANILNIRWQRFISESGGTCSRCELTQEEVKKAFRNLKRSLAPLGIKVALEEGTLDSATCAKDISQSNRIWIGERPLEEWLAAKVGKSPCKGCCAELGADVECRTITVNGNTYEKIPTELIIKAGLRAASERLAVGQTGSSCPKTACSKACSKTASSGCCPK